MHTGSRSLLERQLKIARYMLLGTVIITVVNLLLLLANADFYVPYCASLPYYLVVLGKAFDNNFYTAGEVIGEFTHTGMFMCFILLAALLVLWWLGRRSVRWLKVGMGVLVADTVLLLLIAVFIFGDLGSFMLEILLHCAVIFEMGQGVKAQKQLESMPQEPPVVSYEWDVPAQEEAEQEESEEEPQREEEYV